MGEKGQGILPLVRQNMCQRVHERQPNRTTFLTCDVNRHVYILRLYYTQRCILYQCLLALSFLEYRN